jgi:mono/diheme cytochrome c family protein
VMDAALSGVRGQEHALLAALLRSDGPQTPAREAAIAMVSATIMRAGEQTSVETTLAAIAEVNRADWQRAAVLRGVEVALVQGTPMPGIPRRGFAPSITATAVNAAGAPCPTCPGGRAGPGGAYAFERGGPVTTPAAGRGGRGRGGGGPRLQLQREPSVFAAFAAGTGDLEVRASNALARIEWPGKPGAEAELTPLTAVEQQRFETGRDVYRNICQACHQPDGRGMENVAPPLVGSALVLGAADIPSRVLINGKEGKVGLMPPIGAGLTDDQIAGVLTYIRREWGQRGDPVDPAAVAAVRKSTAERTRPWTEDELLAIVSGAGRGAQ